MQVLLNIKVDPRMKAALKELADRQFISISAAVKQAVERHLQNQGIDWRQPIEPKQGIVTVEPEREPVPPVAHAPAFYAVEIASHDDVIHQFNIQEAAPGGGYTILIKEGSQLLGDLKTGGELKLKLYSANPVHPVENRIAEVIQIRKNEEGRFKGHYTVGLRVLENKTF
jgi:hypothetical protein